MKSKVLRCEIHGFSMVGQAQAQTFAHKGMSLIKFINFTYLRSQMCDFHEIHCFGSVKSMASIWLASPRPKLLLIRVCP